MSDYTNDVRKRRQNLLIVEGNHERNKLFWLLFKCFPEINIDIDAVWIYGTNIFMLYEDIVKEYGSKWADEEDDIDLPFVISKKQYPDSLRYKEDFINIILVFDYERHDTNFSEDKIMKMQKYFADAADMGKLYINYPMIESYQHVRALPDHEYADRKIPVSLQPGKDWLTKAGYIHFGYTYWTYMRGVFSEIIRLNICKANKIQNNQNQIDENNYKGVFEELDFTEILKVQNLASLNMDTGFIWVLNTCVFFVAEYNFALVTEQAGEVTV